MPTLKYLLYVYHIFRAISLHPDEQIYHSTWNLSSKNKWKLYTNKIYNATHNLNLPQDPNNQVQILNDIIYNTALSTIGYRNYHRGYKPWWNKNINSTIKSIKKITRKIQKLKKKYPYCYHHFDKYDSLSSQFKDLHKRKIQLIRIAKKIYNDKINKHLQNSKFDDKLSWRLIKINNNKPTNDIPTLIHNNTYISVVKQKEKILHQTLTNPPPKTNPKTYQLP